MKPAAVVRLQYYINIYIVCVELKFTAVKIPCLCVCCHTVSFQEFILLQSQSIYLQTEPKKLYVLVKMVISPSGQLFVVYGYVYCFAQYHSAIVLCDCTHEMNNSCTHYMCYPQLQDLVT